MLRFKEFVPYAPSEPGVVRINHESATCAGDSRSMRIETHDDGRITAKCFRCGSSGVDSRGVGTVQGIKHQIQAALAIGASREDKDRRLGKLVEDQGLWPIMAYHWVRQYGITSAEVRAYGIMYAEERGRVLLPVWWKGEKVGYQLRRIFNEDEGPKYDTRLRGGYGFMSHGTVTSNEVVIVEDILSAIKVGRTTTAIALLSTGMSSRVKEELSHYDRFYLWLDMDNEQVIRQAVKLLKTLELFGSVKLIQTEKDPKYYDDSEIVRTLYAT